MSEWCGKPLTEGFYLLTKYPEGSEPNWTFCGEKKWPSTPNYRCGHMITRTGIWICERCIYEKGLRW